MNGHDLHGALIRGYVRRTRVGTAAAFRAAHGWLKPYDPSRANAAQAFEVVLDELMAEALEAGVLMDDLWDRLHALIHREANERRSLERHVRHRTREAEQAEPVEERRIDAALSAFRLYVEELGDKRRAESERRFGHTGAYIPEYTPDDREWARRMLAAADGVRA